MILDLNLSWGYWPFQDFRFSILPEMKKFLEGNGMCGGLVRSAEAAFASDLEACNRKLFENLKNCDGFIPVPTVSPYYSEWKMLCDSGKASVCAVFPGYHGYSVLSDEFAVLAEAFEKKNLTLLIVVRQEDERAQHKLCRIPAVPIHEINELGQRYPGLRIVCLNCYFRELQPLLQNAPNIKADIAFVETLNTINSVAQQIDCQQIVFGSHTPFLYPHAALRKLADSSVADNIKQSIAFGNAEKILKK